MLWHLMKIGKQSFEVWKFTLNYTSDQMLGHHLYLVILISSERAMSLTEPCLGTYVYWIAQHRFLDASCMYFWSYLLFSPALPENIIVCTYLYDNAMGKNWLNIISDEWLVYENIFPLHAIKHVHYPELGHNIWMNSSK